MILFMGIVRLFGALSVHNHDVLNLALISYVMEIYWYFGEINAGTYSWELSIKECTKMAGLKTTCDVRTVVGSLGLCLVMIVLILNRKMTLRKSKIK